MKKKGRLARALDALAMERRRVQRDLTEVIHRRTRLSTAVDRLDACRETVAATPVLREGGDLDPDLYLVARTAEARLLQEKQQLLGRLERFDREITQPVRERLKEASVRERAVSTLLRRRQEAELSRQVRTESHAMDEMAARRWQRQRRRKLWESD